jgi:hypothetical protein
MRLPRYSLRTLMLLVALAAAAAMLVRALMPISDAEAMRRAEAFIVLNGYTDLPPAKDPAELTPESFERTTRDQWLAHRRDTLERAAAGVSREPDGTIQVWFREKRKHQGFQEVRVVRMDSRGEQMQMEHLYNIAQ